MSSKKSLRDIGGRIRAIRKENFLNQQVFAESLSTSQGYLSEIEKGLKMPSDKLLIVLSYRYAINKDWILTGDGPKELLGVRTDKGIFVIFGPAFKKDDEIIYRTNRGLLSESELMENYGQSKEELREVYKDFIAPDIKEKITEINIYALAGAGPGKLLVEPDHPIETIEVPKTFQAPYIVPVKVRGDSMEPSIWDGAICGIDTRPVRKIESGEAYAFRLAYEGTVVKRIIVQFEKLILRSDNSRGNPDIELTRQELDAHEDQYGVLGRVVWVIQRRELKEEGE